MNIIVKCYLLWWSKYLFQQNMWWAAVLKRPGQHYLIFVRTTSHADDMQYNLILPSNPLSKEEIESVFEVLCVSHLSKCGCVFFNCCRHTTHFTASRTSNTISTTTKWAFSCRQLNNNQIHTVLYSIGSEVFVWLYILCYNKTLLRK